MTVARAFDGPAVQMAENPIDVAQHGETPGDVFAASAEDHGQDPRR